MNVIVDFFIRAIIVLGLLSLLLLVWGALALLAGLLERKPEELCSCYEIAGDNPECPVHCDMPVAQRPTHFELDLKKVVRNWPVSGPCTRDNTAAVRNYLRRRSKPN